jgi:hypothetical protein
MICILSSCIILQIINIAFKLCIFKIHTTLSFEKWLVHLNVCIGTNLFHLHWLRNIHHFYLFRINLIHILFLFIILKRLFGYTILM